MGSAPALLQRPCTVSLLGDHKKLAVVKWQRGIVSDDRVWKTSRTDQVGSTNRNKRAQPFVTATSSITIRKGASLHVEEAHPVARLPSLCSFRRLASTSFVVPGT